MSEFWRLLEESVIFQGLITLALIGTTCYLVGTRQPVPPELWATDGIVVGYFFGAKAQATIAAQARKRG